ncbi:MAG: proton-conducting transporter membrane subunit [Acidobacteria bacterium]|nr:proton-conducting transporter membrane subunit [Acidobacteriota bacterium]MDA1234015.1 proton-conducting transporter membrane subunit [Acidobacteriota bacterium]
MTQHLPALVFLIPFFAAISLPLVAMRDERRAGSIALAALCAMSAAAIASLWTILDQGVVRYDFGGWAAPIGIEWVADEVAAIMAVAASLLALVCVFYAASLPTTAIEGRMIPFYAILLLLISGLAGVIYAGDLFNLFVFLEIVALSAYALVAVPGGRALVSAFRYLIMGALGASFYLLGVAYFYAATGTLNIVDLGQRIPQLLESKAVIVGLLFMFLGLGIKTALMPLHAWLPDAYSDAPDSVSPIIAALLTKVALLAWVRVLFWVVGAGGGSQPAVVFSLVWSLGALAAVGGAVLALSQTGLRRMFAYGGIAHIGLILVGVGQASHTGLAGGLFYLINDAVMQCVLFIWAGVLAHQYGVRTIEDLKNAQVRNPWILGSFLVVTIGMIGLPPTGGFFGKWYIVLAAVESQNYIALAAVVVTTLLTLAYFVRVLEKLYRGARDTGTSSSVAEPVMSLSFRVGIAVPTAAIIGLGLFSDRIVTILLAATSGLGL